MSKRSELLLRISELIVMRHRLLQQPAEDIDLRNAAVDWLSNAIVEHKRDLAVLHVAGRSAA